MAILIRCKCRSELKLSTKKCTKCGLALPTKGRVYKVIVRSGNRKITKSVSNLNLAREIEAKLKMDISRGEFGIERKKVALSLQDVWDRYLPWAKENKKSWQTDFYYYKKHLGPTFGEMGMDRITPFDIEKFMIKMKKGENQHGKPYAKATIKHQVVLLSRLYSLAEKWGLYAGQNPCRMVKKPVLNNKKTEFLSETELKNLMETLASWPDKMSVAIIKFALYTGLRRGEIFNLRWEDVDVQRSMIAINNPKGGLDQTLPISEMAALVLPEVPRDKDSPWIFFGRNGKKRTEFKGPWLRIRAAAGLPPDFRFHGLRHHFASTLASSGVDLYVIQKLLTHKDASTTQRYAHLSDKAMRDAVNLSQELLKPPETTKLLKIGSDANGK